MSILVNDVHSRLNPTRVREVVPVVSLEVLRAAVRRARREGHAVCVAGGRHAMGGQAFAEGAVLLDMRPMDRVLSLDAQGGGVEVEAGAQWPGLLATLARLQAGRRETWSIAQKQTGADRLTIGGAVAANIHGRGLRMRPFISDVESLVLVDAQGEVRCLSRDKDAELFRSVVGGYGLFGVVASATLRLVPRRKLQRVVTIERVDDLMPAFERRIAGGFLYGDFQFAIDAASPDFLSKGVFSCYRPVDPSTPIPEGQRELLEADWRRLVELAHVEKTRAFELYAEHYLATSGQVYWSDTHQLTTYLDGYHSELDARFASPVPGSETITEVYVPRPRLFDFMEEAARDLGRRGVSLVYGTVRLIERDDESALAWAREPYACVIFNLHTEHTWPGLARSAAAFRALIEMAISRGGSYYLTYHRWAARGQVEACYPQMPEFLRRKREHDPAELFQSEWYRHHRDMFQGRRIRTA